MMDERHMSTVSHGSHMQMTRWGLAGFTVSVHAFPAKFATGVKRTRAAVRERDKRGQPHLLLARSQQGPRFLCGRRREFMCRPHGVQTVHRKNRNKFTADRSVA